MLNSVQLASVDLNLLVLFDVVLREQNVGRAASALHLSPSAVSHGLSRLRRLLEDPLFLRTPKGVVPTARAAQLAPAIRDVLGRVHGLLSSATPFDAASSTRRFTLGMPDATATVLVPALLAELRPHAPLIDLSVRHIFPASAFEDLEARRIDVAVVAVNEVPARFEARMVREEDFVVAARQGHRVLKKLDLRGYAAAAHVLASVTGDAHGFVDDALAEHGLTRRVALVVSNFMLALACVAETDLVTALPRSLASAQAARFGIGFVDAPLALPSYAIQAVAPRAAMLDAGIRWLVETLTSRSLRARTSLPASRGGASPPRQKSRARARASARA